MEHCLQKQRDKFIYSSSPVLIGVLVVVRVAAGMGSGMWERQVVAFSTRCLLEWKHESMVPVFLIIYRTVLYFNNV